MAKKHPSLSRFPFVELAFSLFGSELMGKVLDGRQAGCGNRDANAFLLPPGISVENEAQRSYLFASRFLHHFNTAGKSVLGTEDLARNLFSDSFGFTYRPCPPEGIPAEAITAQPTLFPDMFDAPEVDLYPITALLADQNGVDCLPLLVVDAVGDLDKAMSLDRHARTSPFNLLQEDLNRS